MKRQTCLKTIFVFIGAISDVSTAPGDQSSFRKSAKMNNQDCYCGTLTPEPPEKVGQDYILNGEDAETGEIPWIVQLKKADNWTYCGGTLVGRRHVITAAHCFKEYDKEGWSVLMGVIKQNDSGLEIPVKEIIIHEDFDETTQSKKGNDIAVLVLAKEVDWEAHPNIRPGCLPTSNCIKDFLNKTATISGWGAVYESKENTSTILQTAEVVVTGKDCSNFTQDRILPGMFCAGGINEAGDIIDACTSDSGGPLTVEDNSNSNAHTLIGVVSWGEGCGRKGYPGVYTDVPYYSKTGWLSNALKGLDTCPPPGTNVLTTKPTTPATTTTASTPRPTTTSTSTLTLTTTTRPTTTSMTTEGVQGCGKGS